MPPLRVLCFGDSLTSGYFHFGLGSHPYAIKLEQRLSRALPSVPMRVDTNGLPGDIAAFKPFAERFRNQLRPPRVYDWVIILGGTNDIGMGVPIDKTFDSLKELWDVALSKGSKVLALTVPETPTPIATRDKLNGMILSHKAKNFYTFDLEKKIPYQSLNDSERKKYWDDGVHLLEEGYDWMGDHIADALLDIMSKDTQGGWLEQRLDEELGDPRLLDRGYIVIRKKDLD